MWEKGGETNLVMLHLFWSGWTSSPGWNSFGKDAPGSVLTARQGPRSKIAPQTCGHGGWRYSTVGQRKIRLDGVDSGAHPPMRGAIEDMRPRLGIYLTHAMARWTRTTCNASAWAAAAYTSSAARTASRPPLLRRPEVVNLFSRHLGPCLAASLPRGQKQRVCWWEEYSLTGLAILPSRSRVVKQSEGHVIAVRWVRPEMMYLRFVCNAPAVGERVFSSHTCY